MSHQHTVCWSGADLEAETQSDDALIRNCCRPSDVRFPAAFPTTGAFLRGGRGALLVLRHRPNFPDDELRCASTPTLKLDGTEEELILPGSLCVWGRARSGCGVGHHGRNSSLRAVRAAERVQPQCAGDSHGVDRVGGEFWPRDLDRVAAQDGTLATPPVPGLRPAAGARQCR